MLFFFQGGRGLQLWQVKMKDTKNMCKWIWKLITVRRWERSLKKKVSWQESQKRNLWKSKIRTIDTISRSNLRIMWGGKKPTCWQNFIHFLWCFIIQARSEFRLTNHWKSLSSHNGYLFVFEFFLPQCVMEISASTSINSVNIGINNAWWPFHNSINIQVRNWPSPFSVDSYSYCVYISEMNYCNCTLYCLDCYPCLYRISKIHSLMSWRIHCLVDKNIS